MKVLLLNRISQLRGGADKYFQQLGEILSERGHAVTTFTARCPGDPEVPGREDFPESFHEATMPLPSFASKVRFFFRGIYSHPARSGLARLLERTRPDVAHLNNIYFQLSSSVIDALAEAGVPIVFSLHDYQLFCSNAYLYRDGKVCTQCSGFQFHHGLRFKCYRESYAGSLMSYLSKRLTHERGLLDKVSAFVVPAHSMRRQVEGLGLSGARIEVIPNPFRIQSFRVRESWDPYVVFYGRLIRPKGIYTLLEASRRLPDIPLRIYGQGPEEEGVARYIREHGLSHVLLDTRLRWGSELEEIVGRARYIVVPSEWPVPMDYVLCESLALGRAVITGDVGGNAELVVDGDCGKLFRSGDPSSLAGVMAELYGDLKGLQGMGRRGRQAVETACGEDRFYSRIMSLYEDVVNAAAKS
jgi:glycosyltransferase involved in cell wall biosynthesis